MSVRAEAAALAARPVGALRATPSALRVAVCRAPDDGHDDGCDTVHLCPGGEGERRYGPRVLA